VRLDIEYDGGGFRGWAAQPGLRTVQGELEAALATVLREEVRLTVAGRTDAGVHALGQVSSFATEAQVQEDLARRLNGVGPDDTAITAAGVVEDGFDARRSAKSRSYLYRLVARPTPSPFERGHALWWPHRIDLDALQACAAALPGTHDFTAFTPTQTDHVRFERDILAASWTQDGDILSFRITADAFMRNMVASSSARCSKRPTAAAQSTALRSYSKAQRAATRATPPHPTASTWSRSPTNELPLFLSPAIEGKGTAEPAVEPVLASPRPALGRPSRSNPTGAGRA